VLISGKSSLRKVKTHKKWYLRSASGKNILWDLTSYSGHYPLPLGHNSQTTLFISAKPYFRSFPELFVISNQQPQATKEVGASTQIIKSDIQ
jgi:hypothetical protein